MRDPFITLENVCEAAALLVNVDTYSIKPEVIEDSEDFIIELKTALDNFNKPVSQNFSDKNSFSQRMLFDKNISALLDSTKNLYNILTEDAKENVLRYLENKKLMRINENKDINS